MSESLEIQRFKFFYKKYQAYPGSLISTIFDIIALILHTENL